MFDFDSTPKDKTLSYDVIKKDLYNLIETFINKIDREFPFPKIVGARLVFLTFIYVAKNTYESIIFLCAEKPENVARKIEYSFSSIPLLRGILEQIFAMIFMSENLVNRISWYHKAGWREVRETCDRFYSNYGKDPKWTSWFKANETMLDGAKKDWGISNAEISNIKSIKWWPTPAQMKKHVHSKDLKYFLEYLNDWFYKQFSQVVHLSWTGLAVVGAYFLQKDSSEKESYMNKIRSNCVFQGVTLILALLSEMEQILSFGLKEKLKYLWTIIGSYWTEADELYNKRYKELLKVQNGNTK